MSAARAYLVGIALGLVVLVFIGAAQLPPLASHGDFAELWGAARIALDGGDPYDVATWRADIARVAGRASDAVAFIYPPYVTIAALPLALLPVSVAATLWVLGGVLLAALALGALLRQHPPHPLVAFGLGFALLASGPAMFALAQGQFAFLLLASLCAAAVRWPIASLALVAKPALAPLPLLGVLITRDAASRRRYVVALVVTAALIALTFVKADWWMEWLRGALNFASARPIRTASLFTLVEPLGFAGTLLALLVVVAVLVVCVRSRSLALWFASGIVVAPYIQAYDHLLLLAPLALVASPLIAFAGLVLLTLGDLVVAASGRDALAAVVALAIWTLVFVGARRG